MVKNLPAKHGFHPWSRKIPHAMKPLSLCATPTEPMCHNKRSRCNEKPVYTTREQSALAATRQYLHSTEDPAQPMIINLKKKKETLAMLFPPCIMKTLENWEKFKVFSQGWEVGDGQTPGVGDGQGGLVCCSPRGRKESDMTEPLN